MFGYIAINKPEMKVRDHEEYRSFYCGLCHSLRDAAGPLGQTTLTYDMTFLAVLLTGLYEDAPREILGRCPTHPWRKVRKLTNDSTAYAAQMNVLLAAYNLQDDWLDDRSLKGLLLFLLLSRRCRRLEKEYPRQAAAVRSYLTQLHRAEEAASPDPDLASGLTGRMLAEIFVRREDEWAPELRAMGFFLGKFIYLMDAYEDYEDDRASGSYNPLAAAWPESLPEEQIRQILTMMMAECTRAFERLPILTNGEILRNILYSGVWGRYETVYRKRCAANSSPSAVSGEHPQ